MQSLLMLPKGCGLVSTTTLVTKAGQGAGLDLSMFLKHTQEMRYLRISVCELRRRVPLHTGRRHTQAASTSRLENGYKDSRRDSG